MAKQNNSKSAGVREQVIALAAQGMSVSRIAREVGIARNTVYWHLPEELRPRAVKRIEANDSNLVEKVGATATDSSLPSLPDQPEDRVQRT